MEIISRIERFKFQLVWLGMGTLSGNFRDGWLGTRIGSDAYCRAKARDYGRRGSTG